jgi:hypothetical protein
MLTIFLIFIICILLVALGATGYYLWKFATIIMVFEDDLEDSLSAMNNVDNTMKNLLEMQMFFDSPEVKSAVKDVLDEVTLSRASLNLTIKRFTDRSTQKYITVWDEDPAEEEKRNNEQEDTAQDELEQARMFLEAQRQARAQTVDPLDGMYGIQEQQPSQQRQGTILSAGGPRIVTRR